MIAMQNRVRRPSPYRKPKQVRQDSANWVRAVRLGNDLSQSELAKRLTEMAIAQHSPNITSVWAVKAWEMGKRLPDEPRRKLLEQLGALAGIGNDGRPVAGAPVAGEATGERAGGEPARTQDVQ